MDNEELLFHVKRSFERVRADIKAHEAYIETLRAENQLLKMQLQQLAQQIEQQKQATSSGLFVVKKKNKILVKQKILEYLQEGTRPLAEIKELVVDKEMCCSKASFYRHVDRLKQVGALLLVETDGICFVSAPLKGQK